jgi:hypothetical protein
MHKDILRLEVLMYNFMGMEMGQGEKQLIHPHKSFPLFHPGAKEIVQGAPSCETKGYIHPTILQLPVIPDRNDMPVIHPDAEGNFPHPPEAEQTMAAQFGMGHLQSKALLVDGVLHLKNTCRGPLTYLRDKLVHGWKRRIHIRD